MNKLTISLISQEKVSLFSKEKFIEFTESQKTTIQIPPSQNYNVNVNLLTNQNMLIVSGRFATGSNIGEDCPFVVEYQNSNFTSIQSIDAFGVLLFGINESTTSLSIVNNDTVETIEITFLLVSE